MPETAPEPHDDLVLRVSAGYAQGADPTVGEPGATVGRWEAASGTGGGVRGGGKDDTLAVQVVPRAARKVLVTKREAQLSWYARAAAVGTHSGVVATGLRGAVDGTRITRDPEAKRVVNAVGHYEVTVTSPVEPK